jgi:hypothetical protein
MRSSAPNPTVLQAVKKSLPVKLPSSLDSHTVEKLKEQALAKAKQFKQQVRDHGCRELRYVGKLALGAQL